MFWLVAVFSEIGLTVPLSSPTYAKRRNGAADDGSLGCLVLENVGYVAATIRLNSLSAENRLSENMATLSIETPKTSSRSWLTKPYVR